MIDIKQLRALKYLRILYPFWVLIGIFSIIYVPTTLIEYGNAVSTSNNISNNLLLFRFGIVGSLTTQLLFIIIPLLLYRLLENVDKNKAILMVIFALVSVPITMYNETNKLIITKIIDRPDQVMEAIDMYNQGLRLATIFWGLWLFPLGWLVYKSNFLPKFLGAFLVIGGFGYLLGSFAKLLIPDVTFLNSIFEVMTFGELIFILWLIFRGGKIKSNAQ